MQPIKTTEPQSLSFVKALVNIPETLSKHHMHCDSCESANRTYFIVRRK